jgi:hypothetical protein
MRITFIVSWCALWLTTGCGPKECVLSEPNSCPADFACEPVSGRDKPLCFRPVTLEGKVFDLSNGAAIKGAEVLATDENGAPAGVSTTTADDGTYSLRVPSPRSDEKGTFTARTVRLQSQAKNFVAFPSGARISLPISTAGATRENEDAPYVLSSPLTDVGLTPVDAALQNLPTVSGKVSMSAGQPAVLVMLESATGGTRTTLAGADGSFTLFNVGAGQARLSAWTKGQNYTPVELTVSTSDVADVNLAKASTGTASLSGSVQLVAGANGDGTSVVLVIESTFLPALGRGTVVPGLRSPETGAPTLTGSWTISGLPDGRYVVLAAFENDGNVRDPDPGISGTQIQHLTVSGGAVSGGVSPSFKVTGAVGLVSPGRDAIDATSATPTFSWTAYSNADAWVVTVFDQLGNQIWEHAIGDKSTTSLAYAGPALTAGQYYQWRVTAMRRGAPTSMSEELRGLFRVAD